MALELSLEDLFVFGQAMSARIHSDTAACVLSKLDH